MSGGYGRCLSSQNRGSEIRSKIMTDVWDYIWDKHGHLTLSKCCKKALVEQGSKTKCLGCNQIREKMPLLKLYFWL